MSEFVEIDSWDDLANLPYQKIICFKNTDLVNYEFVIFPEKLMVVVNETYKKRISFCAGGSTEFYNIDEVIQYMKENAPQVKIVIASKES